MVFFRTKIFVFVFLLFVLLGAMPATLYAHGIGTFSKDALHKAKVVRVISVTEAPFLNSSYPVQEIEVEIKKGERKGELLTLINDYTQVEAGQKVFIADQNFGYEGEPSYLLVEVNRLGSLIGLVIFFGVVVILVAGWKGVRALLALAGAMFVIVYLLLPGILQGISPLWLSIAVGSGILLIAIPLTHGWHKRSFVALLGIGVSLVITALFATLAVMFSNMTGFGTEESIYLQTTATADINYVGLLLGGIIIGVLGVLDDIAITQVAIVEEFKSIDPPLPKLAIYKKALRVGRDHIASLVNTLVLAYASVALPLFLLMRASESNLILNLNGELIVGEVIRMIVSSVGLVLAVPIVTFLAVLILKARPGAPVHHHGHHH